MKSDGKAIGDYAPSYSDIEEAKLATKVLHNVFHGSLDNPPVECRESLSSFAFRSFDQYRLLKFFIDNHRMQIAGWACEASCFANNPQPDLQEGLGELEIKVEELRFVVCANNNLLADAQFNSRRSCAS